MADTDVQGMLVRIEATTAQLRQEMARADSSVAQASGKIDKSLGRVDEAFDRAGESAESAAGLIKSALAAAIGAASISKIIETADSYGQMSDRIGMATSSVGEYDQVQQRLLETAKRTYRPLSEAQELYIRTADSLKSMGYDTGQALDVMDSFSFLLVTNSASADKASAAIDAYSKALQTGKVEADGWQSILAAMPTVVDTIAKSTGRSAEEIRSLGAQGKLSLDVLTEGLQKSAEANGVLADSMSVAVRDAVQNLSNAFSVYVGRLNESTDGTGALAGVISGIADNFETLAEIAGVAAAGALAVYARGLAASTAASVLSTKAAIEDSLARRAQAASALLAAQADQRKAQTAVFLAEKESIAAKGTAVQTQMSLQLAEARMAEARATNAVAVAQSAVVGPTRTVLGLLGGPAGIALLAIGAATAFLTLRDNTSVLEQKLGDLNDPLDKLTERFNKLNRATQSVTLRELRASIADTEKDLATAAGSIAFEFQASLTNAGLAGASGFMGGLAPLPAEFRSAMDLVDKAVADSAKGQAVDWKVVADQVRLIPGVTEEMAQSIETGQIKVSDLTVTLDKQRQTLAELTGETEANTTARGKNNAAIAAADQVGQKYLEQLQKQLGAAQDKTALEAANRFIAENTDLTEGMIVAIRSAAAAKDAQKAADDAAAKASKKNASESVSAAKQQLKAFESTEESYKRQIDLINTTGDKQKDATEVAKLSFELQEGKLGKLSEAQKKRLLGMAAELDALNKIKKANEDDLKLTAFKNAQATGTQTTQDGFDQELAGIGMGDKTRDRMRADLALRQKYAVDLASLNEQLNTAEISPELYASETKVLQDELGKRLLAQQNYYSQVDVAQSNWANGASDALQDYVDQAADVAGQTKQLFTSAFNGLEDGIVDFVKTGKLSFKDLANSIIEDLIRIQVRQAAAGFLSSAFGFVSGGDRALGQGTMSGFSEGAMVPNAKGGVYSSASLSSYSGGVYNTPQTFAFAKGAGIFAEAGPEAIMPLTRAADGSLGVRAIGGPGASAAEAASTATFGGITQHISVQGNADENTLARIQDAARRGAEGGYQMMLKDLKQNGPARQLINRR
ncbi:lambda family phage tail tape measure protein [Pseudomonas laurylsulfativorans]|uniref:phage tail tape measure protein n=1 Tax=Pseudomonas laurylsulfativorans TaxID=1943631 RepID=UPI00209F7166|nr:phage tail tape measure protein [Pseudomonas laurylsulfativorans]MCP1419894.1 lambda family phage tail tape measure protein [Pseudomonas laurylsulfativorans]